MDSWLQVRSLLILRQQNALSVFKVICAASEPLGEEAGMSMQRKDNADDEPDKQESDVEVVGERPPAAAQQVDADADAEQVRLLELRHRNRDSA